MKERLSFSTTPPRKPNPSPLNNCGLKAAKESFRFNKENKPCRSKIDCDVTAFNPTELRGRSSGQYTRSIENSYPARSYYVHVAPYPQRDVHGLLRGLPWNRRARRRAGGQRAENASAA